MSPFRWLLVKCGDVLACDRSLPLPLRRFFVLTFPISFPATIAVGAVLVPLAIVEAAFIGAVHWFWQMWGE